jgi:hypothetical protein
MSKGGGGGGQQSVNTQVEPPAYAKPFLEFGLGEAKDLYKSGKPNFYPESTVVGFSPETEMALSGIRDEAQNPNSMTMQTQNAIAANLAGTNPLLNAAFKPAIDSVTSQFAKAGRYGSGANQAAMTSALAPLAYKAQQDAIAQAPTAALMDEKLLTAVGDAKEGLSQAELQDNINRFNFEQNQPMQNLKDYMALVGGGTVGSNTIEPVYKNTAASALGGALGGAQLASGAGFNPMLGAVGGGLLGMF